MNVRSSATWCSEGQLFFQSNRFWERTSSYFLKPNPDNCMYFTTSRVEREADTILSSRTKYQNQNGKVDDSQTNQNRTASSFGQRRQLNAGITCPQTLEAGNAAASPLPGLNKFFTTQDELLFELFRFLSSSRKVNHSNQKLSKRGKGNPPEGYPVDHLQ